MDDADDENTSFAGVQNEDTAFPGVPAPNTTVITNADDNLDAVSSHNSIDPSVTGFCPRFKILLVLYSCE